MFRCSLTFVLFVAQNSFLGFTDGSVLLGIPPMDWWNSSQTCSLISKDDVTNASNIHTTIERYIPNNTDVWINVRIIYSKWTTFIGCGHVESTTTYQVQSADECVLHCSGTQSFNYSAFLDQRCNCLDEKPKVNVEDNDCRRLCGSSTDVACHFGKSALIFQYVTVLDLVPASEYLEKECIVQYKDGSNHVESCGSLQRFHCTKTSFEVQKVNWNTYQDRCLMKNVFVIYGKEMLNKVHESPVWTSIFRINRLIKDSSKPTPCIQALALNTEGKFVVVNCSRKLPFLCAPKFAEQRSDDSNVKYTSIFYVLIAVVIGLCLFIIVTSIVYVYFGQKRKSKKSLQIDQKQSRKEGSGQRTDKDGYMIVGGHHDPIPDPMVDSVSFFTRMLDRVRHLFQKEETEQHEYDSADRRRPNENVYTKPKMNEIEVETHM